MTGIVSTQTSPDRVEEIRLTVPARATYAQIARLTATSVAARIGFSYDEVEDLRIAVGELCGVLVDDAPDSRIVLACWAGDEQLTIQATREPATAPVALPDLSRQILEAVVDEVTVDADRAQVTVVKRRQD